MTKNLTESKIFNRIKIKQKIIHSKKLSINDLKMIIICIKFKYKTIKSIKLIVK